MFLYIITILFCLMVFERRRRVSIEYYRSHIIIIITVQKVIPYLSDRRYFGDDGHRADVLTRIPFTVFNTAT